VIASVDVRNRSLEDGPITGFEAIADANQFVEAVKAGGTRVRTRRRVTARGSSWCHIDEHENIATIGVTNEHGVKHDYRVGSDCDRRLLAQFANRRLPGWFVRFEIARRKAPGADRRGARPLNEQYRRAVDDDHTRTRFRVPVHRPITTPTIAALSAVKDPHSEGVSTVQYVGAAALIRPSNDERAKNGSVEPSATRPSRRFVPQ
jgi:hypothetical protein